MYMVGVLTDNYGKTGTTLGRRVTTLLNTTVVYVLPVLNPDGAVYDFSGGTFHKWRKNRQPIPNSTEIGVDLNRNFRFMWACCGGSSANPAAEDYHGPVAVVRAGSGRLPRLHQGPSGPDRGALHSQRRAPRPVALRLHR